MAGEAITQEFMLGTATVMLGAMSALHDFTPSTHSVGLVKSVKMTVTPKFTDLTQGIRNQVVFSVKTGNVAKLNFDIYEYTGRNISYALGLASGDYATVVPKVSTLSAAAIATAVSVTLTSATAFSVGGWIVLTDLTTQRTVTRQISGIAANVVSFTRALPFAMAIGSDCRQPLMSALGSSAPQGYLGCKILGTTAEGNPATILFGKVRVTSDFMMGFQTDDFSNIPMELSAYDLVSTDANYSDFATQQGLILIS